MADELLALGERQSDPGLLLQANHAAWTTYFSLPELTACRDHAEQGIALYNIDKHRSHASLYGGHDPGVCCRVQAALTLDVLGYADQALEKANDAVTLANELEHPHSQIQALSYSAQIYQSRRGTRLAQELAEETIGLCTEKGIAPHYKAAATILQGWAVAVEGQIEEGISEIRHGLTAMQTMGAWKGRSYYLSLLARVTASLAFSRA